MPARVPSILTTFPAVAALVVGVLYSVGALLKFIQLDRAGVAARDVLPLVPLPQLLANGITAVLQSIAFALLLVPLALFVARDRAANARQAEVIRRLERLRELSPQLLERLEELQQQVDRDTDAVQNALGAVDHTDTDAPERIGDVRSELAMVALDAQRKVTAAQDEVADLEAEGERLNALRSFRRKERWLFGIPYGALALVALVLLPPLYGVAVFMGCALVAVGYRLPVKNPSVLGWLVAAGLLLVGSFIDAVGRPVPLPNASVQTQIKPVTGKLAATTGEMWYLDTGHDAMTAIPIAQIRSASVVSQKRHKSDGLLELVVRRNLYGP